MAGRRPGSAFGRLALWMTTGALIALGQVPFSLPWVTLVALVAVLSVPLPSRGAFLHGWALGFGHFLVALQWITRPFMIDAAHDGWMAPFGLLAMTGGLALFWGAAFWLAAGIAMRSRLPGPLVLVPLWAGAEMLRSNVFTGFPWALIGHVWSEAPLIQTIRLWGVSGLTLATLAVAALMALGLRRGMSPAGGALVILPPALILLALPLLDPGPAPAPDRHAPMVRIVQPNVAQADKTNPDEVPVYMRRLLDLTAAPGAPDLVLWPETALPWLLDMVPDVIERAANAAHRAPLVMGIQREERGRYYNSLVLLEGDGGVAELYDKHHLVPFGEYVPFGDLLARFGIHGLAASEGGGFSPGPGPALIDVPGIGPAMPLICYESIFPNEVRAMPERARVLLVATNDAWFGDFAGPYQHFALGRMRAIEQGLPMMRAANTGVSAVIDGRGRVIESLPLGEAGFIDVGLPPALDPTPWVRTGDGPVSALLGLWLLLSVVLRRAAAH